MNEGFGKDLYRKGNSVKRSGPFGEPPDSENEKLLCSSPSRKSARTLFLESEVSERGWLEGVGDQQRPNYNKTCPPELCSPTHKGA